MKVAIITLGPLHLIKSAQFLSDNNEITVIQGWIPSKWNRWLLSPISKIIGYDLSKTIIKRTPKAHLKNNIGLLLPELMENFGARFLKDYSMGLKMVCWAHKLFAKQARKYLKDIDVLHVRSGSAGGGKLISYAHKQGIKVIVDQSSAYPYIEHLDAEFQKNDVANKISPSNPFWKMVLNDCFAADHLLVNSLYLKELFVSKGIDASKISVEYLGVRKDFNRLKTNYAVGETINILFTGRFSFLKGGEYMLRAVQALEEKGFNIRLTIVGGYEDGIDLIRKFPVKNLNLVGVVPQDDLRTYLAHSDIYLFPSLSEGCANSGMEAMSAGLPVVASRESGLPITDGESGIIVPIMDECSIVNSIETLIQNKKLREKLGVNAADLIRRNYTWEKYAENVSRLYESIYNK